MNKYRLFLLAYLCFPAFTSNSQPFFSEHLSDSLLYISLNSSKDVSERSQIACMYGLFCRVETENMNFQKSVFGKIDSSLISLAASQVSNLTVQRKSALKQAVKGVTGVIINEAHDNPLTRLVNAEIITRLYEYKFTTVFMESLSCKSMNSAYLPDKGLYFRDPSMIYLYQTAVQLGYKLRCYDTSVRNSILRDSLQALRILKQLQPNEKFIVLCGYDHGAKSTSPSESTKMGNVLLRNGRIHILHLDTYKFSFVGFPVERKINSSLSKQITGTNFWGLVKSSQLEPSGIDASAYDYSVIYRSTRCDSIRLQYLKSRNDIKIVKHKCSTPNTTITVFSVDEKSRHYNQDILIDKMCVFYPETVLIGIPKQGRYRIVETKYP